MLVGTIALMLAAGAGEMQNNGTRRGAEDPDQMICRSPEPVLGSRVARRRICRTRAQWQAFEEDRAQMRRDIQNSSKDPTIEQ